MLIRAYAKVNIGLDIVGIRGDGYHLLDMVMQTVDLYDEITITPREDGRVVISCDVPEVPADGRNLAVKAFRALIPDGDPRGVDISIKKNIPSQAGLGGGSSDAAATLIAVNEIYDLGKTEEELEKTGAELGADVSFFIRGGCQRCRGIGEILSPAQDDHGDWFIIVKPDEGASTKEVYAAYDKLEYKPDLPNVLEAVTTQMVPEIAKIKKALLAGGAVYASMTGSGTAVYGIFHEKPSDLVISTIKSRYNNLFVVKKTKNQ